MRILIGIEIYHPFKSGNAYAAYRLANGLAERGHEVFVITSGSSMKTHKTIEGKVTVHRLSSLPLFTSSFRFAPFAKHNVVPIVKEIQPDLIHVEDHFFICWSLIDYAKKNKIPIVGTNHFHPLNLTHYLKLPANLENKLEKLAWKHFNGIFQQLDAVTTPTATSSQIMKDNGFKKKIYIISNGIDTRHYKPRSPEEIKDVVEKYGLSGNFKKLLFVGRLEKEKSVDITIRAVKLVAEKMPVKFFVVGTGSDEQKWKELASELGIGDKVVFLGSLSDEELIKVYNACDVFVTASTVELQGLVVMEAMASGKPIVSSEGMALHELIVDGKNGYIFPNNDYKTEAQKILAVLENPAKTKEMGKASLEMIQQHSFNTTLDKYEDIYREVKDKTNGSQLKKIGQTIQSIMLNLLIVFAVLFVLAVSMSAAIIYYNRSEIKETYTDAKHTTTDVSHQIKTKLNNIINK